MIIDYLEWMEAFRNPADYFRSVSGDETKVSYNYNAQKVKMTDFVLVFVCWQCEKVTFFFLFSQMPW
jgi:hypothetical protein